MELVILGSGSYQPELERHCSGYLLKVGKQRIVFDFGRGTLDSLLKLGVHYYDIDAIFITHHHADHISELSSFLHVALAEPLWESHRKKPITIYGPIGIKERIDSILAAVGILGSKPKQKIFVEEIKDCQSVKLKDCSVMGYEVVHSQQGACLAYRIESNGKIICYSGDTSICNGLKKACKNATVAVIEASEPAGLEFPGHMTTESAAITARESKVKKLVLTHISSYHLKRFDMLSEAKKFFKGPVAIAKDLMKIKV